jgi:hypothetical protein
MIELAEVDKVYRGKRIIDKAELIKSFIKSTNDFMLSDPDSLGVWLKNLRKENVSRFVVYCIYDSIRKEPLYVGKSKNFPDRVRKQLIGSTSKKTGLQQYRRLFLGVIFKESKIRKKQYESMNHNEKKSLLSKYREIIYSPINRLRICFTESHIDALVLEETLIKYFVEKNQCKYNYDS